MSPASRPALEAGLFGDLSEDLVDAILAEAGPLRDRGSRAALQGRRRARRGAEGRRGDARRPAGRSSTAAGSMAAGTRCPGRPSYGGQGLPTMLGVAALEMWNSGSMAFGIGPTLTMGAVEALDKHAHRRAEGDLSAEARLRRVDGHDEPDRAAGRLRPRRARSRAPNRPATAPTASSARRSSSPMASTISPTTSSIWCWRGCPMRRPARAASRCSWCRNSWSNADGSARRAQRRLLRRHRAQARHPRLADLHHDLRRRLCQRPRAGRGRLADRRGESRASPACSP